MSVRSPPGHVVVIHPPFVRSFVRTLDRLQNGEKEGPSGEEVAGETVRGRVDVPRGGADV